MRHKIIKSFATLLITSSMFFGISVSAQTTTANNSTGATGEVVTENKCDINELLHGFESKGSGGYQAENKYGYLGKYQMGLSALVDTGYRNKNGSWTGKDGINSKADFKNNGAVQEKAQQQWTGLLDQRMKGYSQYLGQTMGACQKPMTQGGMIMGAHLMGSGGAGEYLKSGGHCGKAGSRAANGHVLKYSTTDANGTCAGKYMCAGSGCEVLTKDMNKKTCDVVMPMLENLNCQNLPMELRSFCNTNRPYLMTRSECETAEAQSEKAKKGPNKEQCENLSFGAGTGSWSYVLACSYGGDFVADQDGQQNPSGPVTDPECIAKLQAKGVKFKSLGRVNVSSATATCFVENAVGYAGGVIPLPGIRTMTCEMALAMEDWGAKLQSLGVIGYTRVETINCRVMSTNSKTMSEHSYGKAADIHDLVMAGRSPINLDAVNRPLTPDGVIATQAKAMACSSFRQVLSPTWVKYKNKHSHFHVEWASGTSCK